MSTINIPSALAAFSIAAPGYSYSNSNDHEAIAELIARYRCVLEDALFEIGWAEKLGRAEERLEGSESVTINESWITARDAGASLQLHLEQIKAVQDRWASS